MIRKSRPFVKQENIDKLWVLFNEGKSKQELANLFGVKVGTVSRTLSKHAKHQQELDVIRQREKMSTEELLVSCMEEQNSINQNILDLMLETVTILNEYSRLH